MGRKAFALLVAAIFIYTAAPLLLPVTMGAVLAVLFNPILEKLERHKIPPRLASALLTIGITLVILIPTSLMIFFGAKAAIQQLQAFRVAPNAPQAQMQMDWIDSLIQTPKVHAILEWITNWFPVHMEELIDTTHDVVRSVALKLADLLGQVVTALPGLAMAMAVVVVSVFFFLIDGRRLVMFFRRNSFFDAPQTEQMIHSIASMCRSVILASIVSGAIQSLLEATFCVSTVTPNAALIGILVFIASFIPVIGSSPITLGVAAQQFFLDRPTVGIILLVGAVLIAVVDNFIRPWVLKGGGNLHPLIAFVAAFGGLQTFGFLGVFIGPIIAGIFVVVVQILVQGGGEQAKAVEHR